MTGQASNLSAPIQVMRVGPNLRAADFAHESGVGVFPDLKARLESEDVVVVDVSGICDGMDDFRAVCQSLAASLGTLMAQNESGDTVVEVYNRGVGRIEDGARYHQTRQGGDIHTDSVNRPEPMEYLALGCAAPALLGGESIIIRGRDVMSVLKDHPDVVDCLSQEFFFEGRGMNSDNALFKLPILSQDNGTVSFRYLRSYIASAHDRAKQPLTDAQRHAFDVLDCVLEMSGFQHRLTLQAGQILFARDTATFHGRTSFVDGAVPGAYTDRRHMLRYWIDKSTVRPH